MHCKIVVAIAFEFDFIDFDHACRPYLCVYTINIAVALVLISVMQNNYLCMA